MTHSGRMIMKIMISRGNLQFNVDSEPQFGPGPDIHKAYVSSDVRDRNMEVIKKRK
jgi:hypothetical protein